MSGNVGKLINLLLNHIHTMPHNTSLSSGFTIYYDMYTKNIYSRKHRLVQAYSCLLFHWFCQTI